VSSVSGRKPTAAPPLGLVLTSLFRADFLVLLKNRRAVLASILLPVIVLLTTNSGTAAQNLGGPVFVIGLAIGYGLASTSIMGYAVTIARDREKGVFQRLRVTPAPTWTIMASRLAMQSVANLIIALVVVIFGTRLHHISPSAAQYALVLLVSILAGAVYLSIGQALVGLVKSADTVNAVARLVYIALVVLGTIGLTGALGSTWQSIMRWTPVGTIMTLFAGVLNLSAWSARDAESLAVCVAYIVIFAGIGIRWFQWDAR
jgi:ABC-2 type transport system permease protein